jgi:peptide/nickel transport system substrate-binding protein
VSGQRNTDATSLSAVLDIGMMTKMETLMNERDPLFQDLLLRRANRRSVLARATAFGLSAPIITTLLAACGGEDDDDSGAVVSTPASTDGTSPAAAATEAPGDDDQGEVTEGGTLTFGAWQTPDTMDPQKTGLAATSRILFQILTPLVWKFPGDDTFYPGLAREWEVSDDGLEYTFYLREDVTFHNGEPFNADSVTWTFDRLADPEQETLATLPQFDRTEKVDEFTAKVIFADTYGPFLPLLSASVAYMPIPPGQSKDDPNEFGLTPAGTGPFKITEFVHKSHATLVRNDDYNLAPEYFGRSGPAHLEQINWRIIEEPATRVLSLQSGEIDIAEDVAAALVEQIESDPNLEMIYSDTVGCPRSVQLNCEKFPTDSKVVRQAMVYAVNKETITETVLKGTREARWGPLEPLTPCYNPAVEEYYHFDPEKAKELLEEDGWTLNAQTGIREKDGQPLSALFIVTANDKFDEPAQVIQANFKDVGIELELTVESQPTVFNTYNRGDQNLANIFWWGTDPSSLFSLYHSSNIESGFNWSHYRDDEVDDLLERGQKLSDLEERCELYHEAQVRIMEDAALIPIWGKRVSNGGKKGIKGLKWSQNIYPIFYDVHIED